MSSHRSSSTPPIPPPPFGLHGRLLGECGWCEHRLIGPFAPPSIRPMAHISAPSRKLPPSYASTLLPQFRSTNHSHPINILRAIFEL